MTTLLHATVLVRLDRARSADCSAASTARRSRPAAQPAGAARDPARSARTRSRCARSTAPGTSTQRRRCGTGRAPPRTTRRRLRPRSDCDDTDPRRASERCATSRQRQGRGLQRQGRRAPARPRDGGDPVVRARVSAHGDRARRARGSRKRTKVQLRCLGYAAAPFKRVKARASRVSGKLNSWRSLSAGQRVFRAGQTLDVRMTARNRNGTVVRYKLKSGKLPVGQPLLPAARGRRSPSGAAEAQPLRYGST